MSSGDGRALFNERPRTSNERCARGRRERPRRAMRVFRGTARTMMSRTGPSTRRSSSGSLRAETGGMSVEIRGRGLRSRARRGRRRAFVRACARRTRRTYRGERARGRERGSHLLNSNRALRRTASSAVSSPTAMLPPPRAEPAAVYSEHASTEPRPVRLHHSAGTPSRWHATTTTCARHFQKNENTYAKSVLQKKCKKYRPKICDMYGSTS